MPLPPGLQPSCARSASLQGIPGLQGLRPCGHSLSQTTATHPHQPDSCDLEPGPFLLWASGPHPPSAYPKSKHPPQISSIPSPPSAPCVVPKASHPSRQRKQVLTKALTPLRAQKV